jgi:hypothetical protein
MKTKVNKDRKSQGDSDEPQPQVARPCENTKAQLAKLTAPTPAAAKPVASAADLLAERVSDRAIGGGVPLEEWLRNDAAEWALQYVEQVFPKAENESELLFAAEAAFTSATELVCHVLKRGGLDKTYGPLWKQLLKAAKRDVEQFRKENAADQGSEAEHKKAPLPKTAEADAGEQDLITSVEAQMGAWILAEMEGLEWMAQGREGNRANIQAGMRDGMAHGLFDGLWELYVKIHPEQARRTDAVHSQ